MKNKYDWGYDWVGDFTEGFAVVELGDKHGLINTKF